MTELLKTDVLTQILRIIPQRIRNPLRNALSGDYSDVHEVVLRAGKPVCVYKKGSLWYLTENGCLTAQVDSQPLIASSFFEVTDCFNLACGHSVYSHISEITEGFVTISGGHRVGLCGTAVISEDKIINVRDISTISIRFSREIIGSGIKLAREISMLGKGVLICGSPCSGKTTVLRDIARELSDAYSYRVTIVDTRSEIAAAYHGLNQNNVGMCDVLNGFPRAEGIVQAVRTLSPEYIICDEIGTERDARALTCGVNSGVVFVATMHAGNIEELRNRQAFCDIINTQAFSKIVFLSSRKSPGQVLKVMSREEIMCG